MTSRKSAMYYNSTELLVNVFNISIYCTNINSKGFTVDLGYTHTKRWYSSIKKMSEEVTSHEYTEWENLKTSGNPKLLPYPKASVN